MLAIIPCGNKKIWDDQPRIGTVRACDAYIGTFHRLCRTYVEHFCIPWVILSAKHGYLRKEDPVPGPYDLSFNHRSSELISVTELNRQIIDKGLFEYKHLLLLAGKKYKPVVMNSFGSKYNFEMPLSGSRGIGEMQQKLKRAVETDTPL